MSEKRVKSVECDDCDFSMEVTYDGESGTPTEEEYEEVQLFDECPICHADLTPIENDDADANDDLQHLLEDDPSEDELVYRAGVEIAEQVTETESLSFGRAFESVVGELDIPEQRYDDVRGAAKDHKPNELTHV